MLGLKLNNVSKRGHRWTQYSQRKSEDRKKNCGWNAIMPEGSRPWMLAVMTTNEQSTFEIINLSPLDKMAAILADDIFKFIFLNENFRISKKNLTDICSLRSHAQYGSNGSNNGFVSNRLQAIIWSNVGMLYWRIGATFGLTILNIIVSHMGILHWNSKSEVVY